MLLLTAATTGAAGAARGAARQRRLVASAASPAFLLNHPLPQQGQSLLSQQQQQQQRSGLHQLARCGRRWEGSSQQQRVCVARGAPMRVLKVGKWYVMHICRVYVRALPYHAYALCLMYPNALYTITICIGGHFGPGQGFGPREG